MSILSRILENRTVGFLRSKKESRSMRRGLRVGSGFEEFRETPYGRGFILLVLLLIKCFVMFELIEAVRGRLIGSKSWNRSVEIFGTLLVSPYQFRD